MRVEIFDWNGQGHLITSGDPEIIGRWFAEHANYLMTADARMQHCQIKVWPQTEDELNTMGMRILDARFTQDGLLYLAEQILEASKKLGDLESRPL